MKKIIRRPSPSPRPRLEGPVDGRHHTPDDAKPGFTYPVPVPKGGGMQTLFVPFAWYVCGPTNLIAARRDSLLRASAYGEVPDGLSVVLDPL